MTRRRTAGRALGLLLLLAALAVGPAQSPVDESAKSSVQDPGQNPGNAAENPPQRPASPAESDSTSVDTAGLAPYLALAAGRDAKVPWKIGEYFQFSIDWSGLNGGGALMQIQNIQNLDGHRAYRVVTKAESNSFVSKFYKVRDRAETYIDAESLCSRRFEKHLREGGYKKDLLVRFDQEEHKAVYDGGKVFDVPAQVQDVLSAFYYVRTRPLLEGDALVIPTHDNEKSYEMVVRVHKRERIEVPAGKFDCVMVEPLLKSEGVFKSKGQILVWLSDDDRRIPVQVRTKVPVGSITISLTDMRLAFTGKR